MPLAFRIGLVGTNAARLRAAAARLRSALLAEFMASMLEIWRRASARVSGPVLRVRTGHLRRGLGPPQIREDQQGFTGTLGARAKYARIHEEGGRIPAHTIVPRRRQALRFPAAGFTGPLHRTKRGKFSRRQSAGAMIFATRVRIPAITMPARPFLKPSFEEAIPGVRLRLVRIVEETINAA